MGTSRLTGRFSLLLLAFAVMVSIAALAMGFAIKADAQTAAPTIQSDEYDYPPGATVTLTGSDWQPGESVHIYVNDDQGKTWSRDVDVTADANGQIRDQFNLPDWFVATYKVTATGEQSGVATTAFTDGNVSVTSSPVATGANEVKFELTPTVHTAPNPNSNNNCTSNNLDSAKPKQIVGSTTTGSTKNNWALGVDSKDSVRLEAAANASQPSGWTFKGWTGPANSFFVIDQNNPRVICVTGNFTGSRAFEAVYQQQQNTSLSVSSASGTYGGTTALSATLRKASDNTAVSGQTVNFTLNGASAGSATTNSSGVATLNNVSLAGINAGSYAAGTNSGVRANFAGDSGYSGSSGSAALTVNQAPLTVTADNKSRPYGEANPPLTASYSGFKNNDTAETALTGSPALSTTATQSSDVGTYPITAAQGTLAANNYSFDFKDGTLTVNKANQTVSFAQDTPTTKNVGAANFTVSATASSNLPITTNDYGSETRDVCTVSGNTVNIVGVGVCTLTASQGGDSNYNAAIGKHNIKVDKGTQTISFTGPTSKTYGDADFEVVATASSGGTVSYSSSPSSVCTIDPVTKLVHIVGAGECTVTASQTGNANYDDATGTHKITINPKELTGSFTAADKTYDGTTAATITGRSVDGKVGSDDVVLTGGTATFDTASAGQGKTVTGTGFTLTGTAKGNYTLKASTLTTTANIDKRSVTASITAANKTYDGGTAATITNCSLDSASGNTGKLANDSVGCSATNAQFESAGAGNGKQVTANVDLTGTARDNYQLSSGTASTTANIDKRSLTASITADNKTYDGTTGATITGCTLNTASGDVGKLTGDDVGCSASGGTFQTASAGQNKQVTADVSLTGAAKDNYQLTSNTASTTANIDAIVLTPKVTVNNKTYDGTTSATIDTRGFTNPGAILSGEQVTLQGGSAAFETAGAGPNKTVNVTGLSLGGSGAANYTLSSTSTTAQAEILKRSVTASITAANKTYDGQTAATITNCSLNAASDGAGKLSGDDVSCSTSNAQFGSAAAANGKQVTADVSLTGTAKDNYQLTSNTASTNADINPAPLTVKADDKSKVLGASNPTFTDSYSGFVNNEDKSVLGGTLQFATNVPNPEQVGSWNITPSGLTSSNYKIDFVNGTLKIQYAPAGTTCLGAPGHAILQPINTDGTSIFKLGSTVPAKFRVCDANGNSIGTPGVVTSFKKIKEVSGTQVSTINEDVLSTTPDTEFRWSSTDQQWIFNISTKNLTAGKTYVYQITLNDGTTIDFQFGIKK